MPHIHELYDFTISVLVVYEGKVLFVHHPRYDKWLGIGGHIELDEDPEQALFREIAEECGLEVDILSSKPHIESPDTKFILTPNYVDNHEANLPHRHISFIYFAKARSNKAVLSDEHLAMEWLSTEDLENPKYNLSPALKFYATDAIRLAAAA